MNKQEQVAKIEQILQEVMDFASCSDIIVFRHRRDGVAKERSQEICSLIEPSGVMLAKDQSKPRSETAMHRFGEDNDGYDEGKEVMYMAMLKAGFRKVVACEPTE